MVSKDDERTFQAFERMLKEEKRMLKEENKMKEEEQQEEVIVKPKRQISDTQRESLARAREMAQLKKKEMKELTEKKKIIQNLKKEENKIDIEDEYNKTIERVVTKKQPKEIEKPKPDRKIKKNIYEDEEEEEEVKPKAKEFSYVENTRKSAMQQMQDKINEDRMRFLYQKYILR